MIIFFGFRSTKGVPKYCAISSSEFLAALYDPHTQVKRKLRKMEFFRPSGTIAKITVEKRALNGCYSKFYVDDTLVNCKPFE